MAANELLDGPAGDVVDGEAARVLGDLGVEHHLDEQVAELVAEPAGIAGVDGLEDLVGLLEELAPQGLVGLLAVPRAAVRRPEAAP